MSGGPSPRYASIAVAIPVRREFTYEVPEALLPRMRVGARVRVPFGPRGQLATVVGWPAPEPPAEMKTRPVGEILDESTFPDEALLALTRFVSEYYLCSWGEAIDAALPASPRRKPKPIPPGGQPATAAEEGPEPTEAQRRVLEEVARAVAAGSWAPFLLFGATGSGKTEVYLRAAAQALAGGRGVLYLVPEIGLTPLLAARVERRFPGQVAVLHSGLTASERFAAWRLIRAGRRPFVLGARSAIFAPLPKVGLIVVDEEQDGSYKQQDVPRYNARDLAAVRARDSNAVLLLGSATPSLESYHHAKSGRYTLLSLGGRVEARPLPVVRIVDMREEFRKTGKQRPLSHILVDSLKGCVERGEQALVLRNRRGWAPAVLCPACGNRVQCPRCSVTLTWHEKDRRLRCHYCLFETGLAEPLSELRGGELHLMGEGSERIEHELRSVLPSSVRLARMDRDTMRKRGAAAEVLGRFARGEIDVLVGTQMIAKGHDFPNVTLVGVLSADQTLGLPDFRAAERAFQLLTQVAGRAGRGAIPGTVIVQAFDPDHPVLAEAAVHDFEAFYAREIRYRRALRYPPLTAMVQILVTDKDLAKASAWAESLAQALREAGEGRILLSGPGQAPIERLKGLYRQQILARSSGRRRLVAAVDRALTAVEGVVPARAIHVDVDPVSLL